MAETIRISDSQKNTLQSIVAGGKIDISGFNKRTIGALETRGLVKITEQKKGTFVAPTAKGKKFFN